VTWPAAVATDMGLRMALCHVPQVPANNTIEHRMFQSYSHELARPPA